MLCWWAYQPTCTSTCNWYSNAAVRSIASLLRSEHITDTLTSFHWLKAPEHVQYKPATIVYCLLNGMAKQYLAADL